MRLSISTKIFLGFVVVLLAFGGATIYGAQAVHTLGQQLRLLALGYSTLRLELQDQQTIQANLRRRLSAPQPGPEYQRELAADRKLRRVRLLGAARRVADLRRSVPPADALFLDGVIDRLSRLRELYTGSEPLYERIGARALQAQPAQNTQPAQPAQNAPPAPPAQAPPADGAEAAPPPQAPDVATLLRQREDEAARILEQLSSEITGKVVEVVGAGERYEERAVWMTISLAILATGFGVLVMLLVQATLRPLRRLSEGAREVARGNYRQRVEEGSPDEVGALGREFNAMAAALEEREARLRRSEQLAAVGKMAAQIAHEVRNPLSSIGLNAELLCDEVAAGSEAQSLSQAIVKEVDRLTHITEQYLRFARLPEPVFHRGDASALARSLLSFVAGELAGRGVAAEAELGADLPAVRMDENQLRQVLLNLVRNAAEAMAAQPPETRRLVLRTARAPEAEPGEPGRVLIEVRDSGPGIAAEHRARIFEPFFTTKQGGTGLGLALAQEVVLRHGGTLAVESPESGGTVFRLTLPAAPGGPDGAAGSERAASGPS